MVAGVVLGQAASGLVPHCGRRSSARQPYQSADRRAIWPMIVPMMMKVDFASIRYVGARPTGLVITLFVNWVVKPFSTAFFA